MPLRDWRMLMVCIRKYWFKHLSKGNRGTVFSRAINMPVRHNQLICVFKEVKLFTYNWFGAKSMDSINTLWF